MTSRVTNIEEEFHNRRVPDHTCQLNEDENIISRYISNGYFITCRRIFRKMCMVSASDPQSTAIFKSTTKIRLEEIRHLDRYYYIIHPFSTARFYWETFMVVVYLVQLVMSPVFAATVTPILWFTVIEASMCVFVYINMIINFFTGYFNQKKQRVILDWKSIARHYVFWRPYFIADVVGSFPYDLILIQKDFNMEEANYFFVFRFLTLLRLGRLFTLLWYFHKLCERLKLWNHVAKTASVMIFFMILILWATMCQTLFTLMTPDEIQRLVNDPDRNHNTWSLFLDSCHQVVMMLMLVGPVSIPRDMAERIYQAVCLFLGSLVNMMILAQITQMYRIHSKAKSKYNEMVHQVTEYMKHKELPADLQQKVRNYLDFRFQKQIFKESQVMNTISMVLREEIMMHNCSRMVQKVNFFKYLPTALMMKILDKLKTEIYLPGDIIVQAGVVGNSMFFIYQGKVAVYTERGTEICHLNDGSHFGEIALMINTPRTATVIAIANCEVFRLTRKDFNEAIEPYPDVINALRYNAIVRMDRTDEVSTAEEAAISLGAAEEAATVAVKEAAATVAAATEAATTGPATTGTAARGAATGVAAREAATKAATKLATSGGNRDAKK